MGDVNVVLNIGRPPAVSLAVTGGETVSLDVGAMSGGIERFPGPYEVTPSVDGQTLPTASRRMSDDLTINPIPYAAVTNQSGGWTVTIGDVDNG